MAYDDEGLLRDIREQPDDDAPRMVYADWLDEHDDGPRDRDGHSIRANFIRCQCWAEDVGRTTEEWERFRADAAALLAQHRREWEQPLRELGATEVTFRRGLPFHVRIPATAFLEHAGVIFERAPVRSVRITGLMTDQVPGLAALPHLNHLTTLGLEYNYIGDAVAAALAGSPHLANLTTLDLEGNYIGSEGAAALAAAPQLGHLATLNLANNDIGDAGTAALAGSPHLANLTSLYLGDNNIERRGAEALANSSYLGNLTTLDLRANLIGRQDAEALAGSPHLANLTTLELDHNFIPPPTLDNIAQVMASRRQQAK